jgi:hypothetical protein
MREKEGGRAGRMHNGGRVESIEKQRGKRERE